MANHTWVAFDNDGAKLLGDLAGIQRDLEDAKRFASRLDQALNTAPMDSDLVDALTVAILVRYARAFSSGIRSRLHERHLSQLPENSRALHENFMEWRSKHIAHSVNSFEQNQVVARYVAETVYQVGIQDMSVQENRLIGLDSGDLSNLCGLIDALLEIVATECERENARVLEFARALPLDKVLAGPKKHMNRPTSAVESHCGSLRRQQHWGAASQRYAA